MRMILMQWGEMAREKTMRLQRVKAMGCDLTAGPSGYEAIQVEHTKMNREAGREKGRGGVVQHRTTQ